jgi:trehalose-6-phosphate synthase
MNLVAKEYVACRFDEGGALVLSEFTGASIELPQSYLVNPHDIDGLKSVIVNAVRDLPREKVRRMRSMRRRVWQYDVGRWAEDFLRALDHTAPSGSVAPSQPLPQPLTRATTMGGGERAAASG